MLDVAATVTSPLIRTQHVECSKTFQISSAVLVVLLHVLVIHRVTGSRERQIMVQNGFSWKAGDAIGKVQHLTGGANDVIYARRDVTDEQVPCPVDCDCFWMDPSNLKISCKNRATNTSSLPHEINAVLSSVASNLTTFELRQTPLTEVPESVCELDRLRSLGMNQNPFLTSLPDNCFTRLHELRYFASYLNGVTSLQNGLFDNLTNLIGAFFNYNNISSIGAHVFDVTANLPSLDVINLQGNRLTEIDSWPVQRAQLFNWSKIDLSNNRISVFKNSLGWRYDCNSAPLLGPTIDLTNNNISHLNDLLHGWNITGL